MPAEPRRHRCAGAAAALGRRGATLVAGHSAHVFHGVAGRVLYDLGDFVDDYAVDRDLRNDLGSRCCSSPSTTAPPRRLEALPLTLGHCHTRLATGDDAAWVVRRFRELCARLGTEARHEQGRCVVSLS